MVAIACKNLVLNDVEAIIFDKDGTLLNSHEYWLQLGIARVEESERKVPGIANSLLAAFGIENNRLNREGLMAVGSRQENEIVAAGCITSKGYSWFRALEIAELAFEEAEQKQAENDRPAPLFPNSLESLKSLANSGLKLGILSADSTLGVEKFVANYHLEDYIQLSMGTDGNLKKPHPELFVRACRALNVLPNNSLMVGDSLGDMTMAKNAGAKATIGFCTDGNSSHLAIADIVISNMSEIKILQS